MTAKQIEKLNVKIAKKLGWTDIKKENLPVPMQFEKRAIGISPGNFRHQYIPNYFSNLAYAMKLVDWANKNGYDFKLLKWNNDFLYEAHFVYNELGKSQDLMNWGTLPSVAICLAFLKIK